MTTLELKTWRRHRCHRQHRTTRTFLRCAIPRTAWIVGSGTIALIAWCRIPTITLHSDLDTAREALDQLNATGCGGRCSRRHDLVQVLL